MENVEEIPKPHAKSGAQKRKENQRKQQESVRNIQKINAFFKSTATPTVVSDAGTEPRATVDGEP
jgi:hypothetical protein